MTKDPVRHADTIIFPASLDPKAVTVVRRLREAGFESYLVGGCVRDLLLGHIPKDFDASTEARPRQIRRVFRNCRIIGRRFKLAHVHFGEQIIEVATFRRNPSEDEEASGDKPDDEPTESLADDPIDPDIDEAIDDETASDPDPADSEHLLITRDNVYGTAEEDAVRRDFTINALLYDVLSDEVIDYVGGVEDVEKRILRTIGDPLVRIAEDPVRMLRAIKFTARLGLTLEPGLESAMRSSAALIGRSSPPRVLEEIYKLLSCGAAGRALDLLVEFGLLAELLPEISTDDPESRAALVRVGEAIDQVDGSKRSLGNAFLLALLFHDTWRKALDDNERADPLITARDLVAPAALRMNIPRRDVSTVAQLLLNQGRLERSRRGRRFRMADFLARDTTAAAIDMMYVRSLAGLADPENHARWALRMLEARGSSDKMPGAPSMEKAKKERSSAERDGKKRRRRRSRGGRSRGGDERRPGGRGDDREARGEDDRGSDSASKQETGRSERKSRSRRKTGGRARSSEQGAKTPDAATTEAASRPGDTSTASGSGGRPARQKPERSGSASSGKAADAQEPRESKERPTQDTRSAAASSSDTNSAPTTGLKGRMKAFLRKVIGKPADDAPSASSAPATPKQDGKAPSERGPARSRTADDTGSAGSDAPKAKSGEDADKPGTDEREGVRPRRTSRRRKPRGDSPAAADGSTAAGTDGRPAAKEGADDGEGGDSRRRRRRSRSGGQRSGSKSTSNGSDAGSGGERSKSGGRKKTGGRSSGPKSGQANGSPKTKPKRSRKKSGGRSGGDRDNDPTKPETTTDKSGQRHPEDIEDFFDW